MQHLVANKYQYVQDNAKNQPVLVRYNKGQAKSNKRQIVEISIENYFSHEVKHSPKTIIAFL